MTTKTGIILLALVQTIHLLCDKMIQKRWLDVILQCFILGCVVSELIVSLR